jgi:hypothetical protein
METGIKKQFMDLWQRYFPGADWPIVFYYAEEVHQAELVQPAKGQRCLIGDLNRVRRGESLAFNKDAVGCSGGKRYLGFTQSLRPNFDYFLSCGIPGEMAGERYKKSPELVREQLKLQPSFKAPEQYIIFKRWDNLDEGDQPLGVIFYTSPDLLSGLFTLANYDEPNIQAVIAPVSSGCGSIVHYPYTEYRSEHPRAVLGMFDVTARPYVSADVLTLAVPWPKFTRMLGNMEESFLITQSWTKLHSRLPVRYKAS